MKVGTNEDLPKTFLPSSIIDRQSFVKRSVATVTCGGDEEVDHRGQVSECEKLLFL